MKVIKLMLDQTSKRSIFLFIKTIHSARSGSNLECILVIRRPVAENSRCWCPTQLTDFPIVLIKGIRRHRALDPYQFDSATDASRIFRRVVWTCEVSDVLHCALCLIGYRMGLCSQRSLYFWIASGLIYWKKNIANVSLKVSGTIGWTRLSIPAYLCTWLRSAYPTVSQPAVLDCDRLLMMLTSSAVQHRSQPQLHMPSTPVASIAFCQLPSSNGKEFEVSIDYCSCAQLVILKHSGEFLVDWTQEDLSQHIQTTSGSVTTQYADAR